MSKRSNLDINLNDIKFVQDVGSDDFYVERDIAVEGRAFQFEVPGGINVGAIDHVRANYKNSDDSLPHGICSVAERCLDILVEKGLIANNYEWAVVDMGLDPEDDDLFYVHLVSDEAITALADELGIEVELEVFFPDWSLGIQNKIDAARS